MAREGLFMSARIKDKIKEIEQYLEELEEIKPSTFKEYRRNFKTRAACERYVEKIIEAVTDLAFLVIKDRALALPEEDKEAFDILAKGGIIEEILATKLKEAKGMRNILAHQYGRVDDELVFASINEELNRDVTDFVLAIKKM